MSSKSDSKASGPVWSKRVGDANVADANIRFCAGYDVKGRPAADARLAPFDLQTNAAHLLMLVETGTIPVEEGSVIAGALLQIKKRLEAGEEILRPSCEDIHMSAESIVNEIAGSDAGGHLHTARSRNDQVATDMRLWLREEIARFSEAIRALAHGIGDHARKHVETVCPGFTHGQPAMVTSWGHWTMSYIPRILRDLRQLSALLRDVSTCPLGSAASYGTSWPISREHTAKSLGFKYPTPSGTDGIWSRGELELRLAQALAQFLSHLSGIAQDIILLSTPPRDWLHLADEHVTGSSIMPQKRNPDFAEVTRSRASVAFGICQGLMGTLSSAPSGYNRDSQWTKYMAFDAVDNADAAAELYTDVFNRMDVYADRMREACSIGFLNATDVADYLARSRKLPFRTCYKIIGATVRDCEAEGAMVREKLNKRLAEEGLEEFSAEEFAPFDDPKGLLLGRKQTGNPHPEETLKSIDLLLKEVDEEADLIAAKAKAWREIIDQLWPRLKELAD